MKHFAIVELEEGSLTITVGGRDGRALAIRGAVRMPVQELHGEMLVGVLRSLAGDLLGGIAGVHVVLGERRVQHFVTTVPHAGSAEMGAFVVREAMRITSLSNPAEVLASARLLRVLPGGRVQVGVTAAPRHAWEPVRDALQQAGLEVLSLHSIEECLALAVPAGANGRTAVIECGGGRARFVLCDQRAVVQVRRFLVPGGTDDQEAMVAQLTVEVPRTLDWLRESGQTMPTSLLISHRLPIKESDFDRIRDQVASVRRADAELKVPDGQAVPGLAAVALLQRFAAGKPVPSLLDPPRIRVPLSPRRLALAVSVAASLLAVLAMAVVDLAVAFVARDQIAAAVAERSGIEAEIAAAAVAAEPEPMPGPEQERLQQALGLRRPISRLLAELGNGAPPAVRLDAVQFGSVERVIVTGTAEAATRLDALMALSEFARHVRGLPFLRGEGQDEVGEVDGVPNRVRFRFSLQWRGS